jgi:hypothetical protein
MNYHMTHMTYCPGPFNTGCADNALVPHGICAACESKSAQVADQRWREGERLRAAGFALIQEVNGQPLWSYRGLTFLHQEALAALGEQSP